MKKYLEDLEKELKNLKISKEDIKEILDDHMEMIEAAYEDGMTDDDLKSKFGEPEQVAKTLYKDEFLNGRSSNGNVIDEGQLKGYSLFKAFSGATDLEKINISLVSADFILFPYEGPAVEVYTRKVYNIEDYDMALENKEFILKRRKSNKVRLFNSRKESGKFAIRVPKDLMLESLIVKVVSADAGIDNLTMKALDLKTTSGDFELNNFQVLGNTLLTSVSGDFDISGLQTEQLEISLVSGDAEMRDIKIRKDLDVNTVSGDVEVRNLSGGHVNFRTVSGDFEGEEVYVESVEVKSISGDFDINNKFHDQEIVVVNKKSLSGDVTIN